jgi:hypothetical protein
MLLLCNRSVKPVPLRVVAVRDDDADQPPILVVEDVAE